ncbi:MAG: transcription-repair coupling factor [Planctomycetota bacterium]|nr:transcription-repair coupling factor [Planctomycetota bacterium]
MALARRRLPPGPMPDGALGSSAGAHVITDLVSLFTASPAVGALASALRDGRRIVCTGVAGSSTALAAGALARTLDRPVVLVLAHLDDADEAHDELAGAGVDVRRLPALEVLPGESDPVADLVVERLARVREAGDAPGGRVIVAPVQALMQRVPRPDDLGRFLRRVRAGEDVHLTSLTKWLLDAGYTRVEAVEEVGQFALRGGILDVFSPGAPGAPVRLEFFGDTVERLAEVDPDSMASDRTIPHADLVGVDLDRLRPADGGVNFLELLPASCVVLLAETMEIVEQARGYYERLTEPVGIDGPPAVLKIAESRFHALAEINQFSAGASGADVRLDLPARAMPTFPGDAPQAIAELGEMSRAGSRVVVACQNAGERQRLGELLGALDPPARCEIAQAYLHRGMQWDEGGSTLVLVPYHELLSRFSVRRRVAKVRASRAMDTFLDIEPGDYVVHAEHGIARFVGLKVMTPRDLPVKSVPGAARIAPESEEYLTLEFAGQSRLHVPATQVDQVQKYVGGFHGKPPLSTLGGQKWRAQTQRVAESVRDLAAELMRVRAAREHLPGTAFPADTAWQREFEEEFPYDETEDQLAALAEIKKDMQRARPMDRLLCGDVGFGKTELAIRAAFKAVESGRQAAVLVPTTVLAEQHERTFRSRFAGYPFRVESISRFKSDGEVRAVLEALARGHVDVIIGTHRLLSKDVRFADLGLVVIDEEQRFGVEHKESLLRLRLTVDVLTLSATPIPRTLHMAMLGIRDISSLTTPPLDRRAIVTEVIPYNERRVRQAILRELSREGQVFYVHNRVHDILSRADDVRKLVPEARVVVGHGQMAPHELEEVMLAFIRREADVLVATTIIESGIDIASANTMIIDDADRFGLSELHQLRGRVGRGKHRAYCYLLLPPERTIREVAQKRLKAIEQYSMLGAGFKIAMRDLEIRGAGNILGQEQSGHIALVGYEMYCRLLERAVHDLANDRPPAPPSSTSIELGVGGMIPKAYIPSDRRRLEAYRRLATAATPQGVDQALADLTDAYGEPPEITRRLAEVAHLRAALAPLGVRTLTIREKDVVFLAPDPAPLAALLRSTQPRSDTTGVRVLPPKEGESLAEIYLRPHPGTLQDPRALLATLRRRLGQTPPAESAPTTHRIPGKPSEPQPTTRPGPRAGRKPSS